MITAADHGPTAALAHLIDGTAAYRAADPTAGLQAICSLEGYTVQAANAPEVAAAA